MILLIALIAGLIAGLALALFQKRIWQVPSLHSIWLVVIAFLPQLLTLYIPATRKGIPEFLVATSLILSQGLLLIFCWLNRRLAGMWILTCGLALNLIVIVANGGFMPISPQTASHLVPAAVVEKLQVGDRFGYGKDILLAPENTHLAWLSDRFLPPVWFPYQVAFSPGDVVIAVGAFWLMLTQGNPLKMSRNKIKDTQ